VFVDAKGKGNLKPSTSKQHKAYFWQLEEREQRRKQSKEGTTSSSHSTKDAIS
jgi:hypothetical protein